MNDADGYLLVFSTCPDEQVALDLADALVGEGVAACVNILPGLLSVYVWQGRTETSDEHLLLIKTHKDRYAELEKLLVAQHPYELPELVAVSLSNGLPDYLSWISEVVKAK